jgi:hypothetical protein
MGSISWNISYDFQWFNSDQVAEDMSAEPDFGAPANGGQPKADQPLSVPLDPLQTSA